jgi:hypothetical protein
VGWRLLLQGAYISHNFVTHCLLSVLSTHLPSYSVPSRSTIIHTEFARVYKILQRQAELGIQKPDPHCDFKSIRQRWGNDVTLQLKPSPPAKQLDGLQLYLCQTHSSTKISSGKVFGLIVSKRLKSFDYSVDVACTAIYLTSPIVIVFRRDTQTAIFHKKRPYFEMLPRPKNKDDTFKKTAILNMQRTTIQLLSSYTLTPPVGNVNKKMWKEVH